MRASRKLSYCPVDASVKVFLLVTILQLACSLVYGQPVSEEKNLQLKPPSHNATSSLPDPFTKVTMGDVVNNVGGSVGNSWADYDNDGDLDLYVCNYGHNNFFYSNNGDGSFTRITSVHIIHPGNSNAGNWGDYDNDGNLDLVVANNGNYHDMESWFQSNGEGSFNQIVVGSIPNDGGSSQGVSWADYDNDGNVDLFIPNGFYSPENNSLYHNSGDGSFAKITTGDIVTDGGTSFTGSWGDFDNDNDLDLFVANGDSINNFLYHNNGDGTFWRDITSIVAIDRGWSFGGSWADYDNDSDLDLFVTNIFEQNDFLYRNNGEGSFTKDLTSIIGMDGAATAGSAWGDYDNDGDLDLFVADASDANSFLYENNGDGTFTRNTTSIAANDPALSQSCSWADYDNDGDLDLFVANVLQGSFLYRNVGNSNSWINILCKGTVSNRSGIGVKVRAKAAIYGSPKWQLRQIEGQSGFRSQNSLNVEFGFGDATIIDSLIIEWPSGIVDVHTNLNVNQFITAVEGQAIPAVGEVENGLPKEFDLKQNYPNPFNPSTTIQYSIPQAGHVTLKVYNELGQEVATLVNEQKKAGANEVEFTPNGLASSAYFYRIEAGDFVEVKKLVFMK